jgi:hypothetical protein
MTTNSTRRGIVVLGTGPIQTVNRKSVFPLQTPTSYGGWSRPVNVKSAWGDDNDTDPMVAVGSRLVPQRTSGCDVTRPEVVRKSPQRKSGFDLASRVPGRTRTGGGGQVDGGHFIMGPRMKLVFLKESNGVVEYRPPEFSHSSR